jgi:hypothetical protein
MTEVPAHRGLGGVGIAAGDRLDYRVMFLERPGRPAGYQDRAVLEPDELGPEPGDESGRRLVPGRRDDRGVQLGVALRVAEQVVLVQLPGHPAEDTADRGDLPGGGVPGGLPGGECLQDGPYLEDLGGLGLGDQSHVRPAVRGEYDETVLTQSDQHGTHHRTTDL